MSPTGSTSPSTNSTFLGVENSLSFKIGLGLCAAIFALMIILVTLCCWSICQRKKDRCEECRSTKEKEKRFQDNPDFWIPLTGPNAVKPSTYGYVPVPNARLKVVQPPYQRRASVPTIPNLVPIYAQYQEHDNRRVSTILSQDADPEFRCVVTDQDSDRLHAPLPVRRFSSFTSLQPEELEASLYQEELFNSEAASNSTGSGIICFSLVYNVTENTLKVTVHEIKYLLSRRVGEKGRFYVKVHLHPLGLKSANSTASLGTNYASSAVLVDDMGKVKWPQRKTETRSATRNPVFEQGFEFKLGQTDLYGQIVRLVVKERGRALDRSFVVGQVSVRLNEVCLYPHDNQICVDRLWKDLTPDNRQQYQDTAARGQITLSLSYNANTSLLTVTVVKLAELVFNKQASHISIKLCLMTNQKIIKVRDTKPLTVNTEQPSEISCRESVSLPLESAALDEACLSVFVYEKLRHESGHVLGKCVLGSKLLTLGSGAEHWAMLDKTGTEAEMSHSL